MVFANTAKIAFLYTVRYIVPYLPRSLSAMLAETIGTISRRGQQSTIIEKELGDLFGSTKSGSEIKRAALESIVNYRKDLFEIWSFPRLNKNRIEKLTYFEGLENLDNALEKGKGAIIAVSHFGSWKIIVPALAYRGYRVNQIALDPRYFTHEERPAHHNVIMELEYKCEQSLPANFIYIGNFLRPVFRALTNNEVVIDSFDGFMGSQKREVSFFNRRLSLSVGPVVIAFRSGAPLVPAFAVRQKDGQHRIVVHAEIPLLRYGDKRQAVANGAESYARLLRHYVSEYPSHYGRILYDRFRDSNR